MLTFNSLLGAITSGHAQPHYFGRSNAPARIRPHSAAEEAEPQPNRPVTEGAGVRYWDDKKGEYVYRYDI